MHKLFPKLVTQNHRFLVGDAKQLCGASVTGRRKIRERRRTLTLRIARHGTCATEHRTDRNFRQSNIAFVRLSRFLRTFSFFRYRHRMDVGW